MTRTAVGTGSLEREQLNIMSAAILTLNCGVDYSTMGMTL